MATVAATDLTIGRTQPVQQTSSKKKAPKFDQIGLYAALTAIAVLFTLPFLWLVLTSLKPPDKVFSDRLVESDIHVKNYTDVFRYAPVETWLKNSLLIAT